MTDAAPIVVGILLDRSGPPGPLIDEMRRVVDAAVMARRIDRPVTFVVESTVGLPEGSAADVTAGFHRLVARDPLIIMGPTVTDNGLVVKDLADAARIPCCNWTGSDGTRSEWMFHYQIGSLEEEPYVLAQRLQAAGRKSTALIQDRSPIGRRYGAFFDQAAERLGIDVVAKVQVSPVSDDLTAAVERLRRHDCDGLVYLGLGLSAHPLAEAMAAAAWHPAVVANSALMFGYANPDWCRLWEGWVYVDAWSEDNPQLAALLPRLAPGAFPMAAASGYDMGRLLAEAIAGADHLTRAGVKEALERVKLLPAALGTAGTTLGLGRWDRAALKGGYLVLRQWRDGASVLADAPGTG
jgi:ABC-type branched-subunit amino acid transport system substrate-binding protein